VQPLGAPAPVRLEPYRVFQPPTHRNLDAPRVRRPPPSSAQDRLVSAIKRRRYPDPARFAKSAGRSDCRMPGALFSRATAARLRAAGVYRCRVRE